MGVLVGASRWEHCSGSTGGGLGGSIVVGALVGALEWEPWWKHWRGDRWAPVGAVALGGSVVAASSAEPSSAEPSSDLVGRREKRERKKEREDGVLVRGGFSCRNSNSGTKIGALHKSFKDTH